MSIQSGRVNGPKDCVSARQIAINCSVLTIGLRWRSYVSEGRWVAGAVPQHWAGWKSACPGTGAPSVIDTATWWLCAFRLVLHSIGPINMSKHHWELGGFAPLYPRGLSVSILSKLYLTGVFPKENRYISYGNTDESNTLSVPFKHTGIRLI